MPVRWQAELSPSQCAAINIRRPLNLGLHHLTFWPGGSSRAGVDPIFLREGAWSTRGCPREIYRHDLRVEAPH